MNILNDKQQAMNSRLFRDYSFTDSQNDFHESLRKYCWNNYRTGFHDCGDTGEFFKCVFIRDDYVGLPALILTSNMYRSTADTCDYNDNLYVDSIAGFIQTMQSFYLQHEDLFNQMVEDYATIHESVHLEMQKVYDAIIDGIYEQKIPVIK
jgi:hypothetical protein